MTFSLAELLYDAHYTGLMLAKLKRFGRIDL